MLHSCAFTSSSADESDNLCLSCERCNLHKGPNLAGVDPETGKIALLFNPRRQTWKRHFVFDGPKIVGMTETGRATAHLFEMNNEERIALRAALIDEGEQLD